MSRRLYTLTSAATTTTTIVYQERASERAEAKLKLKDRTGTKSGSLPFGTVQHLFRPQPPAFFGTTANNHHHNHHHLLDCGGRTDTCIITIASCSNFSDHQRHAPPSPAPSTFPLAIRNLTSSDNSANIHGLRALGHVLAFRPVYLTLIIPSTDTSSFLLAVVMRNT